MGMLVQLHSSVAHISWLDEKLKYNWIFTIYIYNMTQKVEMIETYHEEMIHDISFDHYGTRFATCSSDQSVKIYGKNSRGQFVR